MRFRAKNLKTPRRNVKVKQELLDKLSHLTDDLEDLRGSVEGSMEDPSDTVELRMSTLELQIKMLGMRLEAWIKAQAVDTDEIQDHAEQINSRLIDIEAVVGDYPVSTDEKIESTLSGSIVSILSKPEPDSPFTSSTWTKSTKDFHSLQSDVLQHKQQYEDFKDALIQLCGQFKSDIEQWFLQF